MARVGLLPRSLTLLLPILLLVTHSGDGLPLFGLDFFSAAATNGTSLLATLAAAHAAHTLQTLQQLAELAALATNITALAAGG